MELRRLYPDPGTTTPAELISRLGLGAKAAVGRPYVVLNMVSSLDGKAVVESRTRALGGEADRQAFHHLRTQADAILVGAGTVRGERYGPAVKSEELRAKRVEEGLAPDPLTVIVSARLNLPADVPLLQDPASRVVIATAAEHELAGTRAQIEYLRTGTDLPLLLGRLRERQGVGAVLCEGGPTLNSHLLAANLVDELFLTLSPQIVGGADALTIVAGAALSAPVGAELVWLVEGEGDLLARWRLRRAGV